MADNPKPTEPPKKILQRRVDWPIKGRLAKNVHAPQWLRAPLSYVVDSFKELGQVHWPNRRATWSLTLAVMVFTIVLAGLILGLDYIFEQLFKRIIL